VRHQLNGNNNHAIPKAGLIVNTNYTIADRLARFFSSTSTDMPRFLLSDLIIAWELFEI